MVTATHSPDLLSMVGDSTFRSTSVICRRPDTEDAVVRPVAELSNAGRLRESQGLGRLHTSGWMEDAILFDTGGGAGDGAERSRHPPRLLQGSVHPQASLPRVPGRFAVTSRPSLPMRPYGTILE